MNDYRQASLDLENAYDCLEQAIDNLDEDDVRRGRAITLRNEVSKLGSECEDLADKEEEKEAKEDEPDSDDN